MKALTGVEDGILCACKGTIPILPFSGLGREDSSSRKGSLGSACAPLLRQHGQCRSCSHRTQGSVRRRQLFKDETHAVSNMTMLASERDERTKTTWGRSCTCMCEYLVGLEVGLTVHVTAPSIFWAPATRFMLYSGSFLHHSKENSSRRALRSTTACRASLSRTTGC